MGTTVQCESYLLGYYSMRDLSEESNSCGWPLYYGDKTLSNGQYYNGFLPRAVADSYSGYEKDLVKRTMLEHEAIFKNQVYELHRLYIIQRNLMDEIKRKELNKNRNPIDALLSSAPLDSKCASENVSKWHVHNFPVANLVPGRPSQNGVCSKDVEVLEVRPMKVRRKMIDLQLPADEYIDTDETGNLEDDNLPSGNPKVENKNGEKLFLEEGVEASSHKGDSSRFCSGLRGANGFVDLNEPSDGRKTVHVKDSCTEENISQNGWHVLGAGHDKSIQKSVSQTFQPDKLHLSSQSVREINARNIEFTHDSHMESSVASSNPSSHCGPNFVRAWNHLLSSWESPSCGLGQKPVSVQAHPFLNSSETLNCNSQARALRQGLYGDKWHFDSNSRANLSYESKYPNQKGFCHGSSSGSKDTLLNFPSISFNHLNDRNDNLAVPENIKIPGATNVYKDMHSHDAKFGSNGSLNGGLESLQGRRKQEEHLASLPWLEGKSACKSEVTNGHLDLNSSLNHFTERTDNGKGLLNHISYYQSLKSLSCSNSVGSSRIETNDQRNRKILGVPIFEKPSICKGEHSSFTSPSMSSARLSEEEKRAKNRKLDINLPCDSAVSVSDQNSADVAVIDKGEDKRVASSRSRQQIDLNSCVSGDEDSSLQPPSPRVMTKAWIDLEAPAPPETEDDVHVANSREKAEEELSKGENENSLHELIKIAAEAIVAISSSAHHGSVDEVAPCSAEASGEDPLCWLAETIDACGNDLERKIDAFARGRDSNDNTHEDTREDCSSDETDYFESMTLKLTETKEEDYMPKPLVPKNLKFEEATPTLIPNRPRRGQARRGRQRRDFQRDILPGIASLSRHEVTEDIQMFGGLMRASGYSWNSGLTRRNGSRSGSTRGRRRLVNNNMSPCPELLPQLNSNIEVAALEDRSFTGWGKTTRRPRRQRCPAGNPPTVLLT